MAKRVIFYVLLCKNASFLIIVYLFYKKLQVLERTFNNNQPSLKKHGFVIIYIIKLVQLLFNIFKSFF